MDRRAQGALMLALGGVAVRLGLSGTALNYIKEGYVPLLVLSGVITAALGAVTLWGALGGRGHAAEHDGHAHDGHDHDGLTQADGALADGVASVAAVDEETARLAGVDPVAVGGPPTPAEDADGHAHGHDHSTGPRVAWMLAAPLFAILLIAPPPLGSFAASRQSGVVALPTAAWPELPAAEDGAIPLSLGDYASRALYDADLSLAGERVRLTGFVSDTTDDGFLLTRFALSCCAADGTAINVEVITDRPALPLDTWLTVEGTWVPRPGHAIGELTSDPPLIEATSITPVSQPAQPYET